MLPIQEAVVEHRTLLAPKNTLIIAPPPPDPDPRRIPYLLHRPL